MAGGPKAFLRYVNGIAQSVVGVVVSAGVANAGDIPALNASGVLDQSVMPPGIGPDTRPVTASSAIPAGAFVNIYNNSGTANVRLADASTVGKECNGFVKVAVASGAVATVWSGYTNDQLTGLTLGDQWLDPANPGKCTATPPNVAGGISQYLGTADTTTSMIFEPQTPIGTSGPTS